MLFFTWPFLWDSSLSTNSMLSAVQVLQHLLLLEQQLINAVTHSFCNNWCGACSSNCYMLPYLTLDKAYVPAFAENSLTKCLPL